MAVFETRVIDEKLSFILYLSVSYYLAIMKPLWFLRLVVFNFLSFLLVCLCYRLLLLLKSQLFEILRFVIWLLSQIFFWTCYCMFLFCFFVGILHNQTRQLLVFCMFRFFDVLEHLVFFVILNGMLWVFQSIFWNVVVIISSVCIKYVWSIILA